MTKELTLRELTVQTLKEVMNVEQIQDHELIIQLMGACAYVFAFPARATEEQKDVLKAAYRKLHSIGSI